MQSEAQPQSTRGFTLLEMSIVIVIIGLIAGGILVGRNLVHASEIRNVMTDLDRFKTAIGTFQSKYNGLPGDITTAIGYWGIAGGTGADATCFATDQSAGTATCNGNGDGYIGYTGSNGTDRFNTQEWFLAWKHLSNAGLVSGTYTGVWGSNEVRQAVAGQNVPINSMGGGYSLLYEGNNPYVNVLFPGKYGHVIVVGANTASWETSDPLFSIVEASLIDAKMDDGFPVTGIVRSYAVYCVTNNTQTAGYDLALPDGPKCPLIFITGF